MCLYLTYNAELMMITRRLSSNPNSAPQILQNWGLPVLPKSPSPPQMAPRELNILYQGNKLIKFWIYSRWSPITIDIVKQVWLKWLVSARFLFHVVKYSNGDQIFPVDVCTIWLYGLLAIVATFAHNELYQTLTMNSLSVDFQLLWLSLATVSCVSAWPWIDSL